MKKYLILFLSLIVINGCKKDEPIATKGDVSGRILEEGSNIPVPGAQVIVSGIDQSHTTGENGSYKITDLYADDYSITVTKLGYITDTRTFTVEPEKITQGDFNLKKDLPTVTPSYSNLSNSRQTESIELDNPRSGLMQFKAETSKKWLSVSPSIGTINPFNKKIINITADLKDLPFGEYDETVVINVGKASLSLPVHISYIEPSNIKITAPLKDDEVKVGQILTIKWTSNLVGKVRVELVKNNNVEKVISPETLNNKGGEFRWNIPEIESEKYRIMISSIENSEIFSISDLFTIAEGPSKPLVKTTDVSTVTTASISIGGDIEKTGVDNNAISNYGHVYSTDNQEPTLLDAVFSLGSINKTIAYTSEIKNLKEGQTYYIRAFATNVLGTSYGEVKTITTSTSKPIITSGEIQEVSETTAIASGNITSDGGRPITQRGICYSTISPATIETRVVKDANNITGEYSLLLTDLQKGTKYYVRAYAVNSTGISYGNEREFRTIGGVPQVSSLSISLKTGLEIEAKGIVENNGGSDITSYGFVWAEIETPTLSDNYIEIGNSIIGSYVGSIKDLKPLTVYYVRAYATNGKGTSYGNPLSITTKDGLPKLTTKNAKVSSDNKVTLNAEITSNEGSTLTSYGFCWSVNPSPTLSDSFKETGTNVMGDYSDIITELIAGRKYYYRAYATNSRGTSYGNEISFITFAGTPNVKTFEASSITPTGATLNGEIFSDGGDALTSFGFCWSRNSSPTTSNDKVVVGESTIGSFAKEVHNLLSETKYYIRAFAINSKGTSYGEEIIFTTKKDIVKATVTTLVAEVTSSKNIHLEGNVTSNGGGALSAYGFCWSTSTPPTIDDSNVKLGDDILGSFTADINKFSPNTTYFIRSYAINDKGISYGETLSVTTPKSYFINFATPYKGQSFKGDEEVTIKWDSNFESKRIIVLLINDGKSIEITNDANVIDGTYKWIVPKNTKISDNNTIQLLDFSSLNLIAESPTFNIHGYLKVTAPFEDIAQIDRMHIKWEINYSTKLKIELYKDSKYIMDVADNIASGGNEIIWNADEHNISEDEGYRIKITDKNNTDLSSLSSVFRFSYNHEFYDERDGQTYRLVEIGNRVWFAEDLRYGGTTSGCSNNGVKYGRSQFNDIVPNGCHIPSNNEWGILEAELGMSSWDIEHSKEDRLSGSVGRKLKSTTGWTGNGNGTNDYGFSALPGDAYSKTITWFTSSDYYLSPALLAGRGLNYDSEGVKYFGIASGQTCYIRLIKD